MNKQQNISPRLIRQSNMELLRIVAMSMIIIGHFMVHAIFRDIPDSRVHHFLTPFFICGVNLFFLLSGYFKIRLSLSSIFRLIVLIISFRLVSNFLYIEWGGVISLKDWLLLIIFPISKSQYWFIKVYFGIMLVSPILNKGLEFLSLEKLRLFIAILSVFTIYSCGIGHNICNENGYSFGQGIYLYCLAHYLKSENKFFSKISDWIYLITAIAMTVVSAIMLMITGLGSISAYNSVFTISVSALIFLYFCNLKIKSVAINRIATAALGCYLLQDGILGGKLYIWQKAIYYNSGSLLEIIAIFSLCFIGFWILSFFVTKIANKLSSIMIKALPERWKMAVLFQ